MCLAAWKYTTFQKVTNINMFFLCPFPLKDSFSNSTCHILTHLWSVRSEHLSGVMSTFSPKKVLCRVSSLPWRRILFQWMNKSTGSPFFLRLHTHASKLSWTQDFWGAKRFSLLLQDFLVNCCFLRGRLDLLCVSWQYVCILYRKTILWSSYGDLPWRVTEISQRF